MSTLTEEEKAKLGNNFCDSFYCYNKDEPIDASADDIVKWWLAQIDSLIEKKLKEEREEIVKNIGPVQDVVDSYELFDCADGNAYYAYNVGLGHGRNYQNSLIISTINSRNK